MKNLTTLLISIVFIATFGFGQTTYVPDDNFEQALIDLGYDDTLDDYVLTANISGVTSLNVNDKSISDLTGIEGFTALTDLDCNTNQLTSLDVSENTALMNLQCFWNQLTALDVSSNTALTTLNCDGNQLTNLDVSANTALNELRCGGNQLTSLDVSANASLNTLTCYANLLTSLNITNNSELYSLNCENNQLTSLNVSNNTALTFLSCGHNQLTSLDVSSNPALTSLEGNNNQLTSLDVSSNTALTELNCQENQLTNLDVSNNTALTELYCRENQLTSLDVTANTALTILDCNNNQLTSLDVSNNTALTWLGCHVNSLASLNVSSNTALTYLMCDGTQLTSLDVSANTALTMLSCGDNLFTSLDVSSNTSLADLQCGGNLLTSLDVSSNPALTSLEGHNNQLTYLNMKNGVTDQLVYFKVTGNSSLTCIETLDPDYATTNWTSDNGNIDAGVTFDVICGAEAQTHWYVATTGSDVQGSGTLESPLANIQTAINATTNGDTVSVAAGTYVENINFSGKNIVVQGEDRETTIIDGNQSGSVVVFDSGEDSTAIISGFTITNGYASFGAGINLNNSNPILRDLIVMGNTVYQDNSCGGGINCLGASPLIENVIIMENSSNSNGGGFCSWTDSNPILSNVVIKYNNAEYGGGVSCNNSFPVFQHVEISNNDATYRGGGLLAWGECDPVLTNVTITNNISDDRGGGLYIHANSESIVKNSILYSNSAPDGNQIFYYGLIDISYSDIQGGWEGEGNIDIDPMFVDAANGDYHLSDWSPCIGAGQDGVDMGAYENALANPRYLLAVDSVYFVHGDTAIVPIRNQLDYPELNSIGLKITGFQDKLSFVGLVTDSTTIFGSLGWITQYNNTDTLLITASAGSNTIDSSGVLFALKLAVPDTLSSQFIPITITEFTGNEEYTDFLVTPGGVQVVWEPLVGFTATQTTGAYPLEVTFTDTSSPGTFPINEWTWDFGDDSTGSGSVITHTYNYPGVYDVSLRIEDEYSLMDSIISAGLVQVDTLYGDVSWNALVQHYDASLILQDLAEIIELDTFQRIVGDVSGDSSLSTLDATLILQYVVGLITELPYDPGTLFLATGDLSMEDHGVAPGSVAAVPINITSGSNIYGFEAVLEFDPAVLEFDTLLLSETMANYLIYTNPLEEGVVKVVASGSNVDGNEGVFATLYFNVSNDFTDATVIQINNLRWNEGEVVENAAEMTLSYALGIGEELLPDVYALHQNYPNPFNPITTLRYDLPEQANVNIIIYDMLGRQVRTLLNQTQDAGFKSVIWNATNDHGKPVSAGVYLYKIQAGEFVQTRKMVLLK